MSLCGTDDERRRRTSEDRATQPMEAGGWVSQWQSNMNTNIQILLSTKYWNIFILYLSAFVYKQWRTALCLLMGRDPTLSSPLGAALRRYSCSPQHTGCGVWGVTHGVCCTGCYTGCGVGVLHLGGWRGPLRCKWRRDCVAEWFGGFSRELVKSQLFWQKSLLCVPECNPKFTLLWKSVGCFMLQKRPHTHPWFIFSAPEMMSSPPSQGQFNFGT